jgi:phosphate-selective porin OprO/OprP
MKPQVTLLSTLVVLALTPFTLADDKNGPWSELDAEPASETVDDTWTVTYKDGLQLSDTDGSNTFKIGGRIMYDLGWQTGEDKLGGSQAEVRTARIDIKGRLNGNVSYKANYDLANKDGKVAIKDLYMEFDDLYGVRVGHFKEPQSLNYMTSSKYITMIERAGIVNAINPGRNSGVGTSRQINDNTTLAFGLFKDASNGFSDTSGQWSATCRATHLFSDSLHVGASGSSRSGSGTGVVIDPVTGEVTDPGSASNTRPGHHMAGKVTLADGDVNLQDSTLYGLEAAWLNGPFSLQAEYISQSFDTLNDAEVNGYYVTASWFLTGEHRPYSKSGGVFSRVVPSKDGGAYELTARLDHSQGEDIDTVEVDDLIIGINWYTGRNSRIMLNYVMADIDESGAESSYDALLLRFQVDF